MFYSRLALTICLSLLALFCQAEKPVLVLFPIDVDRTNAAYEDEFGAALQQGLQTRYEVFYGPVVEAELEKEYKKVDCNAQRCTQNVALAFNGELIADASASRFKNGYLLKLIIRNVLTGKVLETHSEPCRECDAFAVIDRFKQLGRNHLTAVKPSSPTSSKLQRKKTQALRSRAPDLAMVMIPAGYFMMGSEDGGEDEKPRRKVKVKRFALARTETTWLQYQPCIDAGVCRKTSDAGWGKGKRPVVNVNWPDVQKYIAWLNKTSGKKYRLPTEAEWEYAARAGSFKDYSWGNKLGKNRANCSGCGSRWDKKSTAPVASFAANAFGLFDMHGNVWELVEDCWNPNYHGAPLTSAAWGSGDCDRAVLRGGSWRNRPNTLRAANRFVSKNTERSSSDGFRLALDR